MGDKSVLQGWKEITDYMNMSDDKIRKLLKEGKKVPIVHVGKTPTAHIENLDRFFKDLKK